MRLRLMRRLKPRADIQKLVHAGCKTAPQPRRGFAWQARASARRLTEGAEKMNTERVDRAALLAALPPLWQGDVAGELERQLAARAETVVVLDDDPTGTQT